VLNDITLSRIDYGSIDFYQLPLQWSDLLKVSTRPSIYTSFGYIDLSIKYFSEKENEVFFLLIRDKVSSQLIAIFPMSIEKRKCYNRSVKVLQHCITTYDSDVDKPYPVIHQQHEKKCWLAFKEYFNHQYIDWDWLEYDELIPESGLNHELKKNYSFPQYFSKQSVGPVSPIINLGGRWEDFENAHRNMRKKSKRIEKVFGSNYRYVIYHKEEDMNYCLSQYVSTELESWKKNEGVSSKDNQKFYSELLPLLAKEGLVYVGILYDGKIAVSTEISYCYLDRVYFALGTYRMNYSKLSPGSVSTSKFIQFFFDKGYKKGDFLAGFADYINPLSDHIEETKNTVVFKINFILFYYLFMRVLGKIKSIIKSTIRRLGKLINYAH